MEPTAKIKIVQTIGKIVKLHDGEIQMTMMEKLMGNGNATVTVSHTFSNKHFGNGVDTFVSISIKCNQDDNTIKTTANILNGAVCDIIPTLHSEGLAIWRRDEQMNNEILNGGK